MVNTIEAYMPDLDRIAEHSKDPSPVIVSPDEYDEIMDQPKKYGLYRGAKLSDVGILKAMELGWIKMWDPEGGFDLLKQVQMSSVDLRLGHDFWFMGEHRVSRLTMGEHMKPIKELGLYHYAYKVNGDVFVFHPNSLVESVSQEIISLSNVIDGDFDGRSTAGRLGISPHQAAGHFDPGFTGPILMEISNAESIDIAVKIHDGIGAMRFALLDQPSSRPRTQKKDSLSLAQGQVSPFGFWDPKWNQEREESIAAGIPQYDYSTIGDPAYNGTGTRR